MQLVLFSFAVLEVLHPRHVLHFPLCFCGSIIKQTPNVTETASIPTPRDTAVSATTIGTLLQCQYLDKLRVTSHARLVPTELRFRSDNKKQTMGALQHVIQTFSNRWPDVV